MADILSIGKTAQHAIDNFIDLWLTGLDFITGGSPNENTKAPMPFYCAGRGYWFTYNSNVSDVPEYKRLWSYASCDWQIYTKDNDRDLRLDIQYGGIPDSRQVDGWNSAVLNYWSQDSNHVLWNIDDAYIINNQIDYFGYYLPSSSINESVSGFRIVGNTLEKYPEFLYAQWDNFQGVKIAEAHKTRIVNQNFNPDPSSYTYSIGAGVTPIDSNYLNLPRTNDSYWVTIMPYDTTNQNVVNNWYDKTENHNTNNQYLTENNVDNYYNTYEVNLPDGLGFNIGVGGGGINITPIVPVGVAPIIAPELDFDDLIDLLNPIVDDLNNNANYDIEIQLHDFDYYVSRYKDYGDFYIQPLHQYDKIGSAPAFDGTVDFGDIPKVVGESANAYLGLLGGTLSALLCGCFITALIVRKMGR